MITLLTLIVGLITKYLSFKGRLALMYEYKRMFGYKIA